MDTGADLYERDFVAWTEQQAARLRAAREEGLNLLLDWKRVAEEIESSGRSDERELQSRLRTVIEHLPKLQHSMAEDPRSGWLETVLRERATVEVLLEQSPGLRAKLDKPLPQANRGAVKIAQNLLEEHREVSTEGAQLLGATEFGPDQVLGDWLPQRAENSSPARPR